MENEKQSLASLSSEQTNEADTKNQSEMKTMMARTRSRLLNPEAQPSGIVCRSIAVVLLLT